MLAMLIVTFIAENIPAHLADETVVAGTLLPLWLIVATFTLWLVSIIPGIRMVNDRFQNVAADEEPS